jgi:hypothetical protein
MRDGTGFCTNRSGSEITGIGPCCHHEWDRSGSGPFLESSGPPCGSFGNIVLGAFAQVKVSRPTVDIKLDTRVSLPPNNWRPKEKVLLDLGTALAFSPEALDCNRKGRLTKDQIKQRASRCIVPFVIAFALLIGPLVYGASVASSAAQTSFLGGFGVLMGYATHLNDTVEKFGKSQVTLYAGGALLVMFLGVVMANRIPMGLYFDLLEGAVVTKSGRVEATEHEQGRKRNGDAVETFYFRMRDESFKVSRSAFEAIDNNANYAVYVLPRSRDLVSLEPKEQVLQQPEKPAEASLSRFGAL